MDVFQLLDTTGDGMSQGYLMVEYEFVDCGTTTYLFYRIISWLYYIIVLISIKEIINIVYSYMMFWFSLTLPILRNEEEFKENLL